MDLLDLGLFIFVCVVGFVLVVASLMQAHFYFSKEKNSYKEEDSSVESEGTEEGSAKDKESRK